MEYILVLVSLKYLFVLLFGCDCEAYCSVLCRNFIL